MAEPEKKDAGLDPETILEEVFADAVQDNEDPHRLSDQTVIAVQNHVLNEEFKEAEELFSSLSYADQADLIEKLDENPRHTFIEHTRKRIPAVVFAEIGNDIRNKLLATMSSSNVAYIVAELESDDALNLISGLDDDFQKEILRKLSATTRAAVEEGLTFPEESAGRLMQREVVAIPEFWTVGKTLDYLRAAGDHLPSSFLSVYIVDPRYHVLGDVEVSQILRAPRHEIVSNLKNENLYVVKANTDQENVAFLFNKEHLYAVPVVDDDERLIGVITVDDIMEVIQSEAGEDILKLGGVSGTSDIYKAVLETTKSRFTWLAINLVTAILASLVIGLFSATIEQVVALAVLMPIVASMGGNAGTQSLTIAVRALATRELSNANAWRFIIKETAVGFLNGILFAILIGGIAWYWFDNMLLGGVIGAAMVINLIVAGLSGITIPVLLEKLKIDPALASAVFLTTITDVIGFFAFLGLAALVLL